MKKRGFTLIEVIVSIALVSILSCTEMVMLVRYIRNYKELLVENRNKLYTIYAFDILDNQLSQKDAVIEIEDNTICITQIEPAKSIIGIDAVGPDKKDLTIKYYNKYGSMTTKKYIEKSIRAFEVVKHFNTIYIKITTNDGEEYEKCLGIGN